MPGVNKDLAPSSQNLSQRKLGEQQNQNRTKSQIVFCFPTVESNLQREGLFKNQCIIMACNGERICLSKSAETKPSTSGYERVTNG